MDYLHVSDYPTGKDLTIEDWDKLQETKSKALIAIRTDIQHTFEKIKNTVQHLESEDIFSFETLNTYLGKCSTETLNTAFKAKMEALLENEQVGSYNYYKNVLNNLEEYAGENIQISSITVDWLKKYGKNQLDTGKNYTTIGIRCRAIRAILNEAKKAGKIKESQYPFGHGKYEILTGQGRKLALTLQQIKQIVEYSDGNKATEKYRDLWFFSYLCNGMSFADLLNLKFQYCW